MLYGATKLLENGGTHPVLCGAAFYLALKSGYDWKVVSAARNNQAALYAIGRTVEIERPVVTDAPEGTSSHEFGEGLDLQPTLDKGMSVVQDTAHPAYAEKDAILKNFPGITSEITISSGRDFPHIQMKEWQSHKDWKTTFAIVAGVTALCCIGGFLK